MAKSQVSPGPPGWYADPTSQGAYRYWDGSSWTAGRSNRPGHPGQRRRGFEAWLRWMSVIALALLVLGWLVARLGLDGLRGAWFWVPGAGLLMAAFLLVLAGGFLGLWSIPPEDPSGERQRSLFERLLGYGLIDSVGLSESRLKFRFFGGRSGGFGGGNGGFGGGDGGNGGGE